MAVGAAVASYFGANGLKDTKLLTDLAENAAEAIDYEGETPEETEDN